MKPGLLPPSPSHLKAAHRTGSPCMCITRRWLIEEWAECISFYLWILDVKIPYKYTCTQRWKLLWVMVFLKKKCIQRTFIAMGQLIWIWEKNLYVWKYWLQQQRGWLKIQLSLVFQSTEINKILNKIFNREDCKIGNFTLLIFQVRCWQSLYLSG